MTAAAVHDVAVIGAGVVGTAIARELARHELSVVLVEAGPDVGAGTSKANTAILHTGFDATPGTLEGRLVARGHALLSREAESLGIPIEPTGALLVAWTETEVLALVGIRAKAEQNGVGDLVPLTAEQVYAREPSLGPGARAGLLVPREAIVCPFTPPLAYATEAVVNGARLLLSSPVVRAARGPDAWELAAGPSTVRARWVVNAAGLHSDRIDALFGWPGRFTVTPRRGELIVFDKGARRLLRHVILPIPSKATKGVLVAPTVFGNVLLGPTAEDREDRGDTSTSVAGLEALLEKGRRILPALLDEEITSAYAGLRAATEHGDYRIHCERAERYVVAGGIRSTGLSASLAIAEHVVGLMGEAGLPLRRRARWRAVRMPNLGEAFPRPYADAARVAADPEYGRIVCHCERVTRGELRDALASPIPPRTLDGLRRRTRCLMGRCQGFYCLATVAAALAEATGQSCEELLGAPEA